jgi:hypothetical protein
VSQILSLVLAAHCATACYHYADRDVCVYRDSKTCEPHEVECRPEMNCVPVEVKVADVDVVLTELPEDRFDRAKTRLLYR